MNLPVIQTRRDDPVVLSESPHQIQAAQGLMGLVEPDGAPVVAEKIKLLRSGRLNRTKMTPFGQVILLPEKEIR